MERYSADLLPGFSRMMLRIRLVEEALVATIVAELAAKMRKRHKRVCPRISRISANEFLADLW